MYLFDTEFEWGCSGCLEFLDDFVGIQKFNFNQAAGLHLLNTNGRCKTTANLFTQINKTLLSSYSKVIVIVKTWKDYNM